MFSSQVYLYNTIYFKLFLLKQIKFFYNKNVSILKFFVNNIYSVLSNLLPLAKNVTIICIVVPKWPNKI